MAIFRLFLLCALSLAWAEDEASKLTSVVLPSPFEDGRILVRWTQPLKMTEDKRIDFSLFKIKPDEIDAKWSLTIYDGNHPQPLAPDPVRKRDWWPLNRLSNLLLHRLNDGSVSGECYVPAGREWEIDDKKGVFKWTGPERRIHVIMWFANEAVVDPTLSSLEITWTKNPPP